MIVRRAQRGMTLFEVLGALAIAALVVLGLSAMIDTSLGDAKGQRAALHQQRMVNAAGRYIAANYADLAAATADGAVAAVTAEQLKTGGFLAASAAAANAYGQAACVLVRQPAQGRLEALVATYGGVPIPERDLALAAMLAGQGGGYISAALPGTARGASWQLPTTAYRNVACGAAPVLTGSAANDGGHLVSTLSYDSAGQLSANLLYRDAVPGRPQLNQMTTTIHLLPGSGAQAVADDATDPRCTAAGATGKLAADAFGRVLSCQSGVWKLQGGGSWGDPVATHADLPAAGNAGDVRMVTELKRAFTWSGTGWVALVADQDGNFLVPETQGAGLVKLEQTVLKNAPCADNGTLAREAGGLLLSCQSGRWRSPLEFRLTTLVYEQEWSARVDDGTPMDSYIDLTSLPGPRPLYITGYALCHATGFPRAYAYVNMDDDAGPGYIAGGCMSRPDNTGAGVLNKGAFGLQVIPENVNKLHLHREVEVGAGPEDYINIAIKIYNSE